MAGMAQPLTVVLHVHLISILHIGWLDLVQLSA